MPRRSGCARNRWRSRSGGLSVADFTALPLNLAHFPRAINLTFTRARGPLWREGASIAARLRGWSFLLCAVGLTYLSLDRNAATLLTGGEGQRIRLATQIGSRLRGVLLLCSMSRFDLRNGAITTG